MATERNIFFDQERDDLHENGSALRVITRAPFSPRIFSRESTSTWATTPPAAPVYQIELWTFFNQGGNRDSGNDLTYIDQNGDEQNVFVSNNGGSTTFLSTTQYPIATATGDPYEVKRAAVGQAAIDALGYPFTLQNEIDAAHAAGESAATVQADYDANGLGQG